MNDALSIRKKRKDQHVKHVLAQSSESITSDFEHVHLIHQSIPSFNMESVDLSTHFGEFKFEHPLYINAMTGGSEWTRSINEKLTQVAAAVNIPMAVGSMHAALKDESVINSFQVVRQHNPNGIIFANVGADVSASGACRSVKMIDADALQIHLNAPQELIMPEGDRNFKDWLNNIIGILHDVEVPVIVKEVGFGMSKETIEKLLDAGVRYVDISGRGGTNFARIENARRQDQDMAFLKQWGLSTVMSLIESQPYQDKIHVMASGGITSPLDAVKSIALGANAVGMSKAVLEKVTESNVEEAVSFVEAFLTHMKKISVMISARNIQDVQNTPVVLSSEIENWKRQRNL